MKMLWLMLVMLSVVSVTSGCVSDDMTSTLPDYDFKPRPSDMLTDAEMKTLLWHARQFIGRSKQIRMHESAKKYILNNDPECRIRYYGRKKGNIRLEWKITDLSRVILSGTGEFTADRFPWRVELQLYREKYDGTVKPEKKSSGKGRRRGN